MEPFSNHELAIWLKDPEAGLRAQACWDTGAYQNRETRHVQYIPDGPFVIACGAGLLADHVRRFRFSPETIQILGQKTDEQGRNIFHESFLNHLQRLKLQVQVNAAQEGRLLLPGEPLLLVSGPRLQVILLESAIRKLCLQSTHWATLSAMARWESGILKEEDTPSFPGFERHEAGWKIRAEYIGGGGTVDTAARAEQFIREGRMQDPANEALVQIRRLFKGNQPQGDVWLSKPQEIKAGVGRSFMTFSDRQTGQIVSARFTRFQQLYTPVLAKGHPVLPANGPAYFRQRVLKQLEAYKMAEQEGFMGGWPVL